MEKPISPPYDKEFLELKRRIKLGYLSSQELIRLAKLQEEDEKAREVYKLEIKEWIKERQKEEKAKQTKLYDVFYQKHGLTDTDIDNRLFKRLHSLAYDFGHSAGIDEVLNYLDNMMDIYFEYRK